MSADVPVSLTTSNASAPGTAGKPLHHKTGGSLRSARRRLWPLLLLLCLAFAAPSAGSGASSSDAGSAQTSSQYINYLEWEKVPSGTYCHHCGLDPSTSYWLLNYGTSIQGGSTFEYVGHPCMPDNYVPAGSSCAQIGPYFDSAWELGSDQPGVWSQEGADTIYVRTITDAEFQSLYNAGVISCDPGSYGAGYCYVAPPKPDVSLSVLPVFDEDDVGNNPPFLGGVASFEISFTPPSSAWHTFVLDVYRDGANGKKIHDKQETLENGSGWPNGVITTSYSYTGNSQGEDRLWFVLTPRVDGAKKTVVGLSVSWGFDWLHNGVCDSPPAYLIRNRHWAPILAGACSSDPIEGYTGSFQRTETDAVLPGPGEPFTFERSYDSNVSGGEFGPGWTDNLEVSLVVLGKSRLALHSEAGSEIPFKRQANGSYSPPAGLTGTITETADGYALARSDGSTTSFDAQGKLVSITDRDGNCQTVERNADGLVIAVADTAGRRIAIQRDEAGRITKLELPDGRSVGYAYDGDLLTSVVDVRGGITRYEYDGTRLASVIDQNGHNVVSNTYETPAPPVYPPPAVSLPAGWLWAFSPFTGNVSWYTSDAWDWSSLPVGYAPPTSLPRDVLDQVDALGRHTHYSFNDDTGTLTVTDARGHAWKYVYDENGNVASETNPDGATTSFTRDSAGNVTAITDALGNTLHLGYDDALDPTSLNLPDGSSSSSVYNAIGDPTSKTDGLGNTTTIAYDEQGNPTLVTRADGSKASYSYDSHGLPVSYTNPSGATTDFSYDGSGNLTSSVSPLGDVASYGYDAAGNVTSFVDPRGNELGANPDDYRWRETYDAADDLTSVTDPLGNETTLSYDPVGNLISRTDANGHVTGYTYDAANRLIAVTEPDNSVIHYVYDEVGNLIARTDALGRMTTYMYDAENRPVVVTSPAGKTWTLGYDADGNLISMRTPSGGTIGYAHDSLGRVVQVSYSDGTPSVSYTYDAAGNRVSMTDGSGTVRYAYDRLNRLVSVDASAHRQDGAADSSASYLYEPSGNVTDRNIAGAKVSYSYNADGRLASVKTTKPGKKAVVLETDYSYDAAGNLIGTTLPNGVVEARSYDRAGRLTSIHATNPNGVSVFGVDYTLDPAGNPTRAVFDKPSGAERDESYSYDPLGRLIAYCATAGCKGKNKIAYTYDLAGDRLTETIGKKTTAYAYDPDSELLSQTLPDGTKLPYSYDANGNETQAGPWSYSYNLANELIQATNGSTSAAYSYDGDGNRLTEQVSGSTPQTTRYLWDQNFGLPQLAGTQDGSGSTLASFIYGNGPLAMIDVSGAYRYYTTDELGSIRATTGPAGGVRDRGSYQPFGEALANGGGAITNDSKPLAFTGQYLDPVTGLYDMRARNYDSSTGRFQSPDPLGAIDSPEESQYGYARNDPTSFVDPSGMGAIRSTCGTVLCWIRDPNTIHDLAMDVSRVAGGCVTGFFIGTEAIDSPVGYSIAIYNPEATMLLPVAGCLTGAIVGGIWAYTGYEGPDPLQPPAPLNPEAASSYMNPVPLRRYQ